MVALRVGTAVVGVDPDRGGRLSSLTIRGHELLVTPPVPAGPGSMMWGCFVMAPFAGRVRGGRFQWEGTTHELAAPHGGHAMHGTLFDRAWSIDHVEPDYVRLRADLQPGWPFPGHAVHEISLTAAALELRLEVHTAGPAFPATCGWHPWFRRQLASGEPLEVAVHAERWYPRGVDGLPTGDVEPAPEEGPWDDCFTALRWPVALTWPGALMVAMTSTCDHLVLYDEPTHAICVEPQTGPPDALNNLPRATVVRRDQPLVAETSLSWSFG